jgi:hypothetical protein
VEAKRSLTNAFNMQDENWPTKTRLSTLPVSAQSKPPAFQYILKTDLVLETELAVREP